MTSAPVALLACELGSGRGHVIKLARAARAFGPGVVLRAALSRLDHLDPLEGVTETITACPRLRTLPELRGNPQDFGNATWACYLAGMGLVRPDLVRNSLAFWRDQIIEGNVSLLVADFAPLAQAAALGLRAQGWEIRIISLGTGYGVPPGHLAAFPQLNPGHDRITHPEGQVLAALNDAGAALDFPALPRLSALYDVDLPLPATFDFLDPYAAHRPADALAPPLVDRSAELAAGGDEVFLYFSRHEAEDPALLQAICDLPLPRRAYLPGTSDAVKAALQASGVILEPAPMQADAIAARSRLVVHAAPHGTIAMAALAGLPQLGIPWHREQLTHARLAAQAGILRHLDRGKMDAGSYLAAIMAAYGDGALAARARDRAQGLRASFPDDPMADLARRLAPQVQAARGFITA